MLATLSPSSTVTNGRVVRLKFAKTVLPVPLVAAAAAVSGVEAMADTDLGEAEGSGQEVGMAVVVVDLEAAALAVAAAEVMELERGPEEVILLLHPLKQPRPIHSPTLRHLVVTNQR